MRGDLVRFFNPDTCISWLEFCMQNVFSKRHQNIDFTQIVDYHDIMRSKKPPISTEINSTRRITGHISSQLYDAVVVFSQRRGWKISQYLNETLIDYTLNGLCIEQHVMRVYMREVIFKRFKKTFFTQTSDNFDSRLRGIQINEQMMSHFLRKKRAPIAFEEYTFRRRIYDVDSVLKPPDAAIMITQFKEPVLTTQFEDQKPTLKYYLGHQLEIAKLEVAILRKVTLDLVAQEKLSISLKGQFFSFDILWELISEAGVLLDEPLNEPTVLLESARGYCIKGVGEISLQAIQFLVYKGKLDCRDMYHDRFANDWKCIDVMPGLDTSTLF